MTEPDGQPTPTEAEALLRVAQEIRDLGIRVKGASALERPDALDGIAHAIYGINPRVQRERQKIQEAGRANQLATVAIWIASITALASLLTAIATLITVL